MQAAGGSAPVGDAHPKPKEEKAEEKEEEAKKPAVALAQKPEGAAVAPTPAPPTTATAPPPPAAPAPAPPATATAPPPAAPSAPAVETPLVRELASLKAEQARLQEIATSFTISHVVPEELLFQDVDESQSQGLSEEDQSEACARAHEVNGCGQDVNSAKQEAVEDGTQEKRDLEMESVD